jgi:hypothetical protein
MTLRAWGEWSRGGAGRSQLAGGLAEQGEVSDLGVAAFEDVLEAQAEVRVLGLVGEDVELVVVDCGEDFFGDL